MSEDDGNRACGEGGCGYECEEVCVWVLGGRGVGVISGGVMWEGVGDGCRLWRVEDRCGKGGCEEEVNGWFRLREGIADNQK